MGIIGEQNLDKKMTVALPSIFDYTNYRTYLKEYYERRKSTKGYSFRSFSKAAGFNSPNILKLVIDGERNLSREAIDKFATGLRLGIVEAQYFRVLVQLNQAKTDQEKAVCYAMLKRLIPHHKRRLLNPESMEYLSHWLYPVLREMAQMENFKDDPYWISRRLSGRATIKEIAAALRFLVKEGFLEKDEHGRYLAKERMILSSDEVRSLAIRQYHRMMLDQAKESLEDIDMTDREFGALTFTLPEDYLEELKSKLKAFRQEIHLWAMSVGEEYDGDMVTQVNIQMFPQTKRYKNGK